jgi:hypothetical protein
MAEEIGVKNLVLCPSIDDYERHGKLLKMAFFGIPPTRPLNVGGFAPMPPRDGEFRQNAGLSLRLP